MISFCCHSGNHQQALKRYPMLGPTVAPRAAQGIEVPFGTVGGLYCRIAVGSPLGGGPCSDRFALQVALVPQQGDKQAFENPGQMLPSWPAMLMYFLVCSCEGVRKLCSWRLGRGICRLSNRYPRTIPNRYPRCV